MVGVRADEQRRVPKLRERGLMLPLVSAGVTKAEVREFWRSQAFDLELEERDGVTALGNCTLCFLKGAAQIQSLIAEKPERAVWWARMETSITNAKITDGGRFRSDRPSYAQMAAYAAAQRDMFDPNEEAIACFCGD